MDAVPSSNSWEDAIATQRMNDFYIGWIASPLVFGDYPETMKKIVGFRIPSFTNHESELVRGLFDFLGEIHYSTAKIEDSPGSLELKQRDFDVLIQYFGFLGLIHWITNVAKNVTQWPITSWGLQGVLDYLKQAYDNPPIYILENGQRSPRDSTLEDRMKYLQAYIGSVLDAIRS
ncbi:hypothetical protein CRYUN_Cryun14cG0087100 [Craigia yunnanensis]